MTSTSETRAQRTEAARRTTPSEAPAAPPSDGVAFSAEPMLMDLDRLAQFKEFDDEQLSMTREVIDLFVADASARLQAIDKSIRADDPVALAWAAHALVGATSNVGAVAMNTVCSQLEAAAKTGLVPANAASQFDRLQAYWGKTKAILDTWV